MRRWESTALVGWSSLAFDVTVLALVLEEPATGFHA